MRIENIKNNPLFYLFILLCLTLLLYGDILLLPGHLVYSRPDGDFALGYYNLQFALSQIKNGVFPLWCPQLMGGYPYFATLQTLILYPFFILWLIFPMNQASNLFFIAHIFLVGAGTFLWLFNKKLHNLGSLLSAIIVMFSSSITILISMGQTTPLAVLTWFPWILLCTDNLYKKKNVTRDILLTTLFVSLQILGGFPQFTIYSFIAIIFYSAFLILSDKKSDWTSGLYFALMICGAYVFSVLLNAVQLFTTLDVMKETARQTSLPYHFVSTFPLSPYSIITFFAPFFYGNAVSVPYWGPWLDSASINFLGITSLLLAFYALVTSKRNLKWISLIIIIPFFIYALGNITPIFKFIIQLPLLSKMRVPFRAIFFVNFFIAALAGLGVHELSQSISIKALRWTLLFNATLLAIIAFLYAKIAHYSTVQNITIWQAWTAHVGKPVWTKYLQHHAKYAFTTASDAKSGLLFAMVILLISFLLFCLLKYYKRTPILLFTLLLFELLSFAVTIKRGFPIAITYNKTLKTFLKEHPSDARFIKIPNNNWAMSLSPQFSGGDVNGYESFRLSRYEDFVNFNQAHDIGSIQEFLQITRYRSLYRLLRCKYFFIIKGDKKGNIHYKIINKSGALPHLLLIGQWKVLSGAKQILTTMKSPTFTAEKNVILEDQPHFYPAKQTTPAKNNVQLIRSSSQWLDIKATTNKNSILLVTDAYAKGWKAFPYPDSSQMKYDVMPADYVIRGIPLSPGTHHFRLEYAPDAFYRGRNISIAALIAYFLAWCALLGLTLRKKMMERNE